MMRKTSVILLSAATGAALTLFVTPVIYLTMERLSQWLLGWRARDGGKVEAEPAKTQTTAMPLRAAAE